MLKFSYPMCATTQSKCENLTLASSKLFTQTLGAVATLNSNRMQRSFVMTLLELKGRNRTNLSNTIQQLCHFQYLSLAAISYFFKMALNAIEIMILFYRMLTIFLTSQILWRKILFSYTCTKRTSTNIWLIKKVLGVTWGRFNIKGSKKFNCWK